MMSVVSLEAQLLTDAEIVKRARREGITAAEFPGYAKRLKENAKGQSQAARIAAHPYSQPAGQMLSGRTSTQSLCNNLDFENVNHSGWSTFTGSNTSSFNPPVPVNTNYFPASVPNMISLGASTAFYHVILDSANSLTPDGSI